MDDTRWEDARRIEGWAGEVRVNLVRIAGLVTFYTYHLIYLFALSANERAGRGAFHARLSVICLLWALAALVLHVCLYRRRIARWMGYISAGWDVILITALLALAEDGPKNGLVLVYFLIVASSALRLSLGVVYMTTVASVAGYLLVLAHYIWNVVGVERYHADLGLQVSRSVVVLVIVALTLAGLLAGQVVRQARRLVAGYPIKVTEAGAR